MMGETHLTKKKQPFTSIYFHGTGPTPTLGSRLIDGTGTNANADAMTQYGLSKFKA